MFFISFAKVLYFSDIAIVLFSPLSRSATKPNANTKKGVDLSYPCLEALRLPVITNKNRPRQRRSLLHICQVITIESFSGFQGVLRTNNYCYFQYFGTKLQKKIDLHKYLYKFLLKVCRCRKKVVSLHPKSLNKFSDEVFISIRNQGTCGTPASRHKITTLLCLTAYESNIKILIK